MTIGIEWPLEPVRHIPAPAVARRSHHFCSHPATAAGAANEKNLVIRFRTEPLESCFDPIREIRSHPVVGCESTRESRDDP